MTEADLEQLGINVIRGLAMDAPQRANSGHPGTAMALAPLAHVLWTRVMRYDPADPSWPDRDRFILSAGHACILQYAMLYLTGYGITLEDLKEFRQWESRTPGHPEVHHTPGIEITTGPLGQGFANAVGMGIAERSLRARFGPEINDHYTFVVCSDGDLVDVGSTAQFQVRDAASADDELHRMLDGRAAAGALVFTCNGRGTRLFGRPDHDAEIVVEHVPPRAVAGMFCAGELGPVGRKNFLHGFTASVVLFGGTQA